MIGIGLMSVIASAVSADASFANQRLTLAVAKWRSGYMLKDDCPSDLICMRWPYFARFDTIRSVSGDRLEKAFDAKIWVHSKLPRDREFALLIAHKPKRPEVVMWTDVQSDGSACFPAKWFSGVKLDVKFTPATDDESICVDTRRMR